MLNIHDYVTIPLPALPQTQALDSETFKPPVLDGSLTITEMYDWHFDHTPNHPIFIFPRTADGATSTILWPEAVRAIRKAGKITLSRFQEKDTLSSSRIPVIATLAASDTISYYTTVMGIAYVGYTVFPMSPRNSAQAVAHLIRAARVTHIIVGAEKMFHDLAAAAIELLRHSGDHAPHVHEMPFFDKLYSHEEGDEDLPSQAVKSSLDTVVFILHSSGSTSFPKPIFWTHLHLLQWASVPYFGERDLTGVRFASPGIPMFHGMGMFQTVWTAATGVIITVFEPKSPAIVPTPEVVFKHAVDTNSDLIFCVPSFVEVWYENKEYVSWLSKKQGVLFGGAPLNKEVGDALSKAGVSLFSLFGTTEIGIVTSVLPRKPCPDWQYICVSKLMKTEFLFNDDGKAELIIHPHAYHVPVVTNVKRGDVEAYATGDLFTPHPTLPDYWTYYGRADDQIVHSTGEKTNPGPLENILAQDPHVQNAIIFGSGKFNCGVLINPVEADKFDVTDTEKVADYRNKIWPTVERMNLYAPQHSRIFKEMIIIASPSKPFVFTAKNTPRRPFLINQYEPEINALYAAVAETTQPDLPVPSEWNMANTLNFVRTVVARTLGKTVDDQDAIFQHGADSLQATWIRNYIFHAVRTSAQVDTRKFPGNLVYLHPSISALSTFVYEEMVSSHQENRDVSANQCQEMESMVETYSQAFQNHVPSTESNAEDIVLVTGTTGGVGAYILAELLGTAKVSKVYAINRKNKTVLLERQKLVLENVGLDPALASHSRLVLLETDISESGLGLSSERLEEVPWPVDFNITLATFQPQVKGVRNLIDFALSSSLPEPPRFIFMSSIGVFRNLKTANPVQETAVDSSIAVGSGYGESKWVSERILLNAAAETTLRPIIIRLGQLSGGLNGYWKEKEWVPSLIRSSIHLKCLPALDQRNCQSVTWIPMAVAARAITEMRNAGAPILHVAHPKGTPWSTIFQHFSKSLNVPIVPYKQWLDLLEDSSLHSKSSAPARENPASIILDFFRAAKPSTEEAMGLPRMSINEAQAASTVLGSGSLSALGASDVELWLNYWRKTGFLPTGK
ncbi:hypothetical protein SERLADRAFT_444920 [Serpula lacrymans var. lacrymans S7.9]|uniref:Acetyl-CoA synthetase-like protein n=1 Tax=Serpula lacrymans var. lacrymans (strain S7.9) TaxID=578457 RepID=F8NG98_SERL9|nr:uncharacterized protein SERLADRAFT_444920 [Serpula lacrymans var. lacrymans S7.9]EGO29034.1 hypothetical protein SERLADRAFT_444920 [Serpula lacrymans var. lacrymans S7.9]